MKRNAFLTFGACFTLLGAAAAQAPDASAKPDALVTPPATTAPAADLTTPPVVPINGSGGSEGRGWHVTSDVGFYFMQPEWRTNPAYTVAHTNFFDEEFAAGHSNTQTQEFGFGMQAVPRISLGVATEEGLGVRINWWQYSGSSTRSLRNLASPPITDEASQLTIVTSATPLQASVGGGDFFEGEFGSGGTTNAEFTARLRVVVWDLEVTDEIKAGRWKLTPSAGIRYAHISQDYDASIASNFTAGEEFGVVNTMQELRSSHTFNGFGPTIALDAQRQLGSSNFTLYATPRASLLVGKTQQSAFTQTSFSSTEETTFATNSVFGDNSNFTVIPVAEIEAGVRWERTWGRRLVFVQAGVVGQVWFGAGNSSRSSSPNIIAGEDGEGEGEFVPLGSTVDNDLGFLGFTLRAGVQF